MLRPAEEAVSGQAGQTSEFSAKILDRVSLLGLHVESIIGNMIHFEGLHCDLFSQDRFATQLGDRFGGKLIVPACQR